MKQVIVQLGNSQERTLLPSHVVIFVGDNMNGVHQRL